MPLEVKHLSYIYNQGTSIEHYALNDISFSIADGEFVAIIGHTGSGKSTLIQHFNALLKPTAGQVLLDGEDINADKTALRSVRQQIGLVFQYPEHQLFESTVYRDVAFGPMNMGLPEDEIKKRVEAALFNMGLSQEVFEKSPFELSGGQKRRVAIAGVLATNPRVLVLDEPTAGLDPKGREELFGLIQAMHERLNITIVLVSHSMEDVARLVNRIIVLNRGCLFDDGTPEHVFSRGDELMAIGLSTPVISRLMSKLNDMCMPVRRDIFTVKEGAKEISRLLDIGVKGADSVD